MDPLRRPLMQVTVHVVPAAVFPDEAADFMQAVRAAGLAAAGNEFHGGVVGVLITGLLDSQPEPLEIRRIRLKGGGPGAGMPGGEQVGQLVEHESAVARAHQRFGRGSLHGQGAFMPAPAAVCVGRAATRTGCGQGR